MSLKVFGLYMMLIPGIGLMIFPEFLLDMFKLSHGEELWLPRMVGLLAFVIGTLDVYISRYRVSQLYGLTVYLRYFAALFMVGLWLKGEAGAAILLFAGIDAAGATWTLLTSKMDDAQL